MDTEKKLTREDAVQGNERLLPGFPGYYVTRDGRVRSDKRGGRWLCTKIDKDGYLCVCLYQGRKHYFHVHTLVLLAFGFPRPYGMECCHNDGDPRNNRLENLRWDTRKGNYQDSIRHGTNKLGTFKLGGGAHSQAILLKDDVKDIRGRHCEGERVVDLANEYKVSCHCVSAVVHRRTWKGLL